MRNHMAKCIVFILLFVATGIGSARTQKNDGGDRPLTGAWEGRLTVPGGSLRLVFHFAPKPGGGYLVKIDSPDQGAEGIPGDSVFAKDSVVWVSIAAVRGIFDGRRVANTDSLFGKWKQIGEELPLGLRFVGEHVAAPNRPQEPAKPYPYKAEEVTYPNSSAGISLAGTLTLPAGPGPFPAAVLITGSGPQDRDETVFGHHPFLVLSDYLTRNGIAVLRSDDRGVGKSTGTFGDATTRDFAGDVESAVAYLRTRKEIRGDCIGLIGHSEGGIIAPMVAAESKAIAFIVMMAGPGVTGEEVILKQSELISRGMGAPESTISEQVALNAKLFSVVKAGGDSATMYAKLKSVLMTSAGGDTAQGKNSGNMETAVDAQIRQVMSPWFKSFLTYDPRPALEHVRCPVLAVNGEKDLQVPPAQNLPAIRSALHAGGNKDFTVRELPGLNHLFQHAEKGTPDEYSKNEETISPDALKIIGDWIAAHCH